jgi:predicted homoserine dehydrogenase-like protein
LTDRANSGRPLRVALIGAGTFGTMILSQLGRLDGVLIVAIADRDPSRADAALGRASVGVRPVITDALDELFDADPEVVIEATGAPAAGIAHARMAIEHGCHVVMVNVEADVLAGPELARLAARAGVVYSLAYGDQPALICELVDWARACGFRVVGAGKGTKYLPGYHEATPDTVWGHYGFTPEQVAAGGYNARMFTSFLDGTKSAIEMAAVANATGLVPPSGGLAFPPCGAHEIAERMIPAADGGVLEHAGMVEVISSLHPDGSTVERDLRWGVYVTVAADSAYVAQCFRDYGLMTDATGAYAGLFRPSHLIGLETPVSVLAAGLLGEATGTSRGFVADVVAVAKRDLAVGQTLDGEGGFTVSGRVVPASPGQAAGLPIGLAHGVTLRRAVTAGTVVGCDDVDGLQIPVEVSRSRGW